MDLTLHFFFLPQTHTTSKSRGPHSKLSRSKVNLQQLLRLKLHHRKQTGGKFVFKEPLQDRILYHIVDSKERQAYFF